jgi:hypothetical protein
VLSLICCAKMGSTSPCVITKSAGIYEGWGVVGATVPGSPVGPEGEVVRIVACAKYASPK